MEQKMLRYPTILFDWGDTVMRDDPASTVPMVEWQTVQVVEGIADVLAYLHSSGRRSILATSASISDESQIREALMAGDGFEKDVQAANAVGIFAVWFNPRSDESLTDELHVTVHSMQELLAFFTSLDRNK
jgi:phosphoglycolate phosphatase-like HAD superfamily hydrolase